MRVSLGLLALILWSLGGSVLAQTPGGVTRVLATRERLVVCGTLSSAGRLAELQPYETDRARGGVSVAALGPGAFNVTLPRFDGPRDRLYSAFVAQTAGGEAVGRARFV